MWKSAIKEPLIGDDVAVLPENLEQKGLRKRFQILKYGFTAVAPVIRLKPMLRQSPAISPASWNNHSQRGDCFGFVEFNKFFRLRIAIPSPGVFGLQFGHHLPWSDRVRVSKAFLCNVSGHKLNPDPIVDGKKRFPQNMDLPPVLPKNKKKPYPIPLKTIQRLSRIEKKQAEMGIEKHLEPPKNGLLVPDLIPVAHEVLQAWKVLIKGLTQLLHVVPVYGCRHCPEVHVGEMGHEIQDCRGSGNVKRRSFHSWVKGSINDILIPIESYHIFDPFGRRIKHDQRFDYDRIPAVVELCIQAGIDLPQYPSRRRVTPIRMLGKKVIDRGGFIEEPRPIHSQESPIPELDTYGIHIGHSVEPMPNSHVGEVAEKTLEAWDAVRGGVRKLMRKYTVKACGYCSEVHVGPWGHNAKLCGAFKHQWRDGKHGWQDATLDEVVPPNYVWHVQDPRGGPLKSALKRFYGKAPAVVEVCVQAGAQIPERYRPMMRLDIVVPDCDETPLVA